MSRGGQIIRLLSRDTIVYVYTVNIYTIVSLLLSFKQGEKTLRMK